MNIEGDGGRRDGRIIKNGTERWMIIGDNNIIIIYRGERGRGRRDERIGEGRFKRTIIREIREVGRGRRKRIEG